MQWVPSQDDNPSFGAANSPGAEYASVALTVAGRDVSGLALVTATGGSVGGRITFEAGVPRTASPAPLIISAVPMGPQLAIMMGGGSARVRDDWTFEVPGLFDRRRLRINTPPSGWYFKSVSYEGNDVTDTGIDFTQGQKISNVEIVLTQRTPTLGGLVMDVHDKPVNDYVVAAFVADSSKWGT